MTFKKTHIVDNVKVRHGDILYCPNGEGINNDYHLATVNKDTNEMEIRCLTANNIYMYQCDPPFVNIGHYSLHLDIFYSDNFKYNFGISRERAEKLSKKVIRLYIKNYKKILKTLIQDQEVVGYSASVFISLFLNKYKP